MTQASNLRRVRREDNPIVERRTDGLDVCLDYWATWMGKSDKDLGAQRQKLGGGAREDGDYESDQNAGDSARMRREDEIAIATDAMINSLTIAHRWAISRKCGVCTTWRYPQLDYLSVAIEACVDLEKKLRGNVATRMLFL
jgi:hypothetical protein